MSIFGKINVIPIFHLGRSGSTYLDETITKSFDALSLSEIFNRNTRFQFLPREIKHEVFFKGNVYEFLVHSILRGMEQDYWLQYSLVNKKLKNTIFFEYAPYLVEQDAFHPCHSDFIAALNRLEIKKVIILERKSVLRRILSYLIALQASKFHVYTHEENISFNLLEIDPYNMTDYAIMTHKITHLVEIQKLNDLYFDKLKQELLTYGIEYVNIEYESHISENIEVAINMIKEEFDLKITHFKKSDLKKTSPEDLKKIVGNYDEVKQYIIDNKIRI